MSKKIILMGFVAFCMALAGCNSGNGTGVPVSAAELLGRWNFTQAKYHTRMVTKQGTVTKSDTTIDTTTDVTGKGFYVEFKDSSKFSANIPTYYQLPEKASAAQIPTSGTWSVEGSRLTMIMGAGIYKDTLIAETAITGSTVVFTTGEEMTEDYNGFVTTYSSSSVFTATKQP